MKRRYTIETLAAGQQRPYGPTIYRHQILYEHILGSENWIQSPLINEERVIFDARHFSGWSDPIPDDAMSNHFRTKLDYLKMIEPGLWEWQTSSPYTD